MNRQLFLIFIALAITSASSSNADSGYVGGSVIFLNLDQNGSGINDDSNFSGLVGRIGKNFSRYLSGEIRFGFGLEDGSIEAGSASANVSLDSVAGVYMKGGSQIFETVFPYILLGYTRGEISASGPTITSDSEYDEDISFGLGLDVRTSKTMTINVEYINYFDKNDVKVDGISVGLLANF